MKPSSGNTNATKLELYSQLFPGPTPSAKVFRRKKALAFCGFPGTKGTQRSFTFFYSFPIFLIGSYSNSNTDWVARKAFVSIETICSIREKVYLVAHEI